MNKSTWCIRASTNISKNTDPGMDLCKSKTSKCLNVLNAKTGPQKPRNLSRTTRNNPKPKIMLFNLSQTLSIYYTKVHNIKQIIDSIFPV